MSKTVSKFALTAGLVLAMAFTFSCSGDDGGDDPSSSSVGDSNLVSSSSGGGQGGGVSSSVIAPSSGSVEPSSSSGEPSSSGGAPSCVAPSSPSSGSEAVLLGYCDYGPFNQYGGGCYKMFTGDDLSNCESWGQRVGSCPITVSWGSMTDSRDCKEYKTVQINGQVWFAENLNYETGNSACYSNQASNCATYGRLYDWETAMTACPSGWRLPSKNDWNTLVEASGGHYAGRTLKTVSGWNYWEGTSGNGMDNYGFSALPGGYGDSDGSFKSVSYEGYWWSADEDRSYNAYYQNMSYSSGNAYLDTNLKGRLHSVRCLQVSP
jgi:uncharacterized protein (TIGR02145 family)